MEAAVSRAIMKTALLPGSEAEEVASYIINCYLLHRGFRKVYIPDSLPRCRQEVDSMFPSLERELPPGLSALVVHDGSYRRGVGARELGELLGYVDPMEDASGHPTMTIHASLYGLRIPILTQKIREGSPHESYLRRMNSVLCRIGIRAVATICYPPGESSRDPRTLSPRSPSPRSR